jgi:hypothetical protein
VKDSTGRRRATWPCAEVQQLLPEINTARG